MMRTINFMTCVGLMAVLLTSPPLFAGVDKDDGDFVAADWTSVSAEEIYAWYVDSSDDKPAIWTTKQYTADDDLDATHVKKEDGTELAHVHYKEEWGDSGCPSKGEADAYWDARFASATPVTTASKQHKTCHEWALSTSSRAAGIYDYRLTYNSLNDVLNSDLTSML